MEREIENQRVLTHLSLFSGIGGLDLAAEWAGFRSVGQCEWADYPTKILEKHWPAVPRWRDIRTLTGDSFYERTGLRTVELISGGFPCQPFSCAGKRRGCEDDRYLWPEMLRVIQEIRPAWVVGENVANIVNMALDKVLSDLEGIGYACQAFIVPACAVDAPHRRDRCAIVAYTNRHTGGSRGTQAERQQRQAGFADGGYDVANADGAGQQGGQQYETPNQRRETKPQGPTGECGEIIPDVESTKRARSRTTAQGGRAELGRCGWWSVEPGMGGGYDGFSDWLDSVRAGWADDSWEYGIARIARDIPERVNRLKCLGNAVVPAQFYPIFQAVADIEKMNCTSVNVTKT